MVKKLPFILVFMLVIATGVGAWLNRSHLPKPMPKALAAPSTLTMVRLHQQSAQPFAPQANLWSEYHTAREQAMREHPELAAEFQEILAEAKQQQADLDAAMIKANPKVAPLVNRLALMRQHAVPAVATAPRPSAGSVTR